MRRLLLALALVGCSSDADPTPAEEIALAGPGLCDGSADVKLAVTARGASNTGGFTGTGRFLLLNGKCEFVTSSARGTDRGLVTGTFSEAQARTLQAELQLGTVASYRDTRTCLDGVTTTITTATVEAECACGCDVEAPAPMASAVRAVNAALDLAVSAGSPWQGPVELGVMETSVNWSQPILAWPFAFPIDAKLIYDPASGNRRFDNVHTLEGAEAATARALRDATRHGPGGGQFQQQTPEALRSYSIVLREKLPAAFRSLPDGRSLGCMAGLETCAAQTYPPATYDICDGSDDIRFGRWSSGGFVDGGFYFSNDIGSGALFVNGRCEFVANYDDGALVGGTFTREQAAELATLFDLGRIEGRTWFGRNSQCPDAGTGYVVTATGYVEHGCGIDPAPFATFANGAFERAKELALASGRPLSGALTAAAIALTRSGEVRSVAWPLALSIDELAVDSTLSQGAPHFADAARTMTGADAQALRATRATAEVEFGRFYVRANERDYALYTRDEPEPAFAAAIERFKERNLAPTPQPIARCGKELLTVDFPNQTFVLADSMYRATTPDWLPCGARLCWDESFTEAETVGITLRVEAPAQSEACLEDGVLRADLGPVVERFHAAYPNRPVQVAVEIAGASGEFNTAPIMNDLENEAKLCAALSPQACMGDARCRPLTGQLVEGTCLAPVTTLGCGASVDTCYESTLVARAADGRTASFPSDCLPEGWRPYSYQRIDACN